MVAAVAAVEAVEAVGPVEARRGDLLHQAVEEVQGVQEVVAAAVVEARRGHLLHQAVQAVEVGLADLNRLCHLLQALPLYLLLSLLSPQAGLQARHCNRCNRHCNNRNRYYRFVFGSKQRLSLSNKAGPEEENSSNLYLLFLHQGSQLRC